MLRTCGSEDDKVWRKKSLGHQNVRQLNDSRQLVFGIVTALLLTSWLVYRLTDPSGVLAQPAAFFDRRSAG
jgi:hypothetical protein